MGLMEFIGIRKKSTVGFEGANRNVIGTAPTEEDSENVNMNSDRQQKVLISRDPDGCEWAYENDVTTYNGVQRLNNILNNGFEIEENDKYTKRQIEKARNLILDRASRYWDLRNKLGFIIAMRAVHGWGVWRVLMKDGWIDGLMEMDTKELKPIRNLKTGRLGDGAGIGLDGERPRKDIVIVQKGNVVTYSTSGEQSTSGTEYFYFDKSQVVVFPSNDRGKIAGKPAVWRCLRLIETKMSIQNMIELVIRRFGPQAWIMVGNKDVNLTNTQIPQKYLIDQSTGNPKDLQDARDDYRNNMFGNIQTQLQKWSNGEALLHIAEYGIEPKITSPTGAIMNYERYVELFADMIKIGILGLDVPGRVDVTSSTMIENLSRDIRDRVKIDREFYINKINYELVEPTLEKAKLPKDVVKLKFKNLDEGEIERQVMIEFRKSQTVFNYLRAGTEVPEKLKREWGMKEIKQAQAPKEEPKATPKGKPAGIQYQERS